MRLRDDTPPTAQGLRVALLFALAAQRLHGYYEHGHWLTDAHCAHLAADWLARSKNTLPLTERRQLAELSDQLARQIAGTLSREVGLMTAHDMMEALDPNYHSDIAESLLAECARLLNEQTDAS
ncbi:MAG: hypothetical protein PHT48_03255 [Dechloromonas sp.]|nr:hypothetical protein [Dechloromonas sp.]